MINRASKPPTQKQFIQNLESKMIDPDFIEDVDNLIRPGEI